MPNTKDEYKSDPEFIALAREACDDPDRKIFNIPDWSVLLDVAHCEVIYRLAYHVSNVPSFREKMIKFLKEPEMPL